MRLFVLLLFTVFISGCFEAPLKHDHVTYNYEIKYGQSPNNLDQSLTASCIAYYHDTWNYDSCYKSINQIAGYICAVDGRLYLRSTSKGYRSVSTAVTPLDNIYCKVSQTTTSTVKYEYVDGWFEDTDIPVLKD